MSLFKKEEDSKKVQKPVMKNQKREIFLSLEELVVCRRSRSSYKNFSY